MVTRFLCLIITLKFRSILQINSFHIQIDKHDINSLLHVSAADRHSLVNYENICFVKTSIITIKSQP